MFDLSTLCTVPCRTFECLILSLKHSGTHKIGHHASYIMVTLQIAKTYINEAYYQSSNETWHMSFSQTTQNSQYHLVTKAKYKQEKQEDGLSTCYLAIPNTVDA